MILQFIAATFLKFHQQCGCPCGISHLVGVVEEGVRIGCLRTFKGLLDMFQVIGHRRLVEMVYHQSLATRCSSLYAHHTIFDIHSHQLGLLRCAISQVATCNLLSHVTSLSVLIEHHFLKESILGIFLG